MARWAQLSVWDKLLEELEKSADPESISIDTSYVKLHQHGTDTKGAIHTSDLRLLSRQKVLGSTKGNMIGIFIKNNIWLNVFC